MNEMYKRIEKLALERGLSMYALADRTNVPRSRFSELKNGKQENLSTKNLKRVADYLGVTAYYLIFGEEKSDAEPTVYAERDDSHRDNTLEVLFHKMPTSELLRWLSAISDELQKRQDRPEA